MSLKPHKWLYVFFKAMWRTMASIYQEGFPDPQTLIDNSEMFTLAQERNNLAIKKSRNLFL